MDARAVEDSGTVIATEELDDLTLVVRAQEGDTRSFETLVRRHQRQLYRLAVRLVGMRLVGNSSDAEEAVQEAFLDAWRRLSGFRAEAAFLSWIYRIVTNRCLTLLRMRWPAISLDDVGDQPGPHSAGPEYAAETDDRAAALNRALQKLPIGQRTCWVLRELHGLSYEDIAIIVGASPDAVRGRLHRARRTLVEAMTLVEGVMGAVLAELRPADYLPLPTRHGQARIDRSAAAGVLCHAVDQMPALRVRSCQIHLTKPAGATGSPTARVYINVTARFKADLLSATARVRQVIFAAAEDVLGLPAIVAVTITGVDYDDWSHRRA